MSTLGSTLAGVGIAVHVYARTGSVALLGLLMALAAAPAVLVVPVLGIVDRVDRRAMMITADVVAASGTAVGLVLAASGRLEVWHLGVVGVVAGLGNALQFPAYQAAIPDLVPAAALGRANGLVQLAPALAIVVGPAVATGLLATGGLAAVLAVDLVTCVVGVTATAATRFRSRPVHRPAGETASEQAPTSAWRWLRTEGRPLLALMGVVAVVNLALSMFNVSLLALATDLGGTARAGLAPTVGGLGMVAASLVLARRGIPAARIRAVAGSLVVVAAGVAITGLRPWFWLVVVGVALAMSAVPLANAVAATLFHEHVPATMHGRVFGLRAAAARALDPAGSMLAGVVVAGLARPVVTSEGPIGDVVALAVGHGPARDTAVVAIGVGAALVVAAIAVTRMSALAPLRRSDPGLDAEVAQLGGRALHEDPLLAGGGPWGDDEQLATRTPRPEDESALSTCEQERSGVLEEVALGRIEPAQR